MDKPVGVLANFSVKITVAIVLLLLGTLFVAAFLLFPQNRPEITFTAAMLGGAAALYSAYYAGVTLNMHLHRDRLREGFHILESLNQAESVRLRNFIEREQLDSKALSAEDLYKKIVSNEELLAAVTHVLGVFEDASIAIQAGYVEEHPLEQSMGFLVKWTFECLEPYVKQERAVTKEPDLYIQVERLSQAWRANKSLATGKPFAT